MLYNGLVRERKLAAAALLLCAGAACGPPKQARFTVDGCEAFAAVPPPESWYWRADPDPVLATGPLGAWDSVDVLNPSVVNKDALFYNLYSGFDGKTWHTGLATSADGRKWEKIGNGPVLSPLAGSWEGHYIAANGSLLHTGREFRYWYQAGRPARIGLAHSSDARRWQRRGPPVLGPGPAGSWDEEAVADPYVIRCRNIYYLYYLGQNRRGTQRIGVARSTDGVAWQKHMGNPLLDLGPPGAFDERGLGEPAVFRAAAEFYMIYTGRSPRGERRLGAAQSQDGVRWRRAALPQPIAGQEPWNARVVCDPTVWAAPGGLWLWFGGGAVASPDENLRGQIGLAKLEGRLPAAR